MSAILLFSIEPPEAISVRINSVYSDLLQHRHSALPPHFSLFQPVTVPEAELDKLISLLTLELKKVSSQPVVMDGIDTFVGKTRVIYLKTDSSSASYLHHLHDLVGQQLKQLPGVTLASKPFVPHLTLAKQIPEPDFDRLLRLARQLFFPFDFTAEFLIVYRFSKTTGWQKVTEIKLG